MDTEIRSARRRAHRNPADPSAARSYLDALRRAGDRRALFRELCRLARADNPEATHERDRWASWTAASGPFGSAARPLSGDRCTVRTKRVRLPGTDVRAAAITDRTLVASSRERPAIVLDPRGLVERWSISGGDVLVGLRGDDVVAADEDGGSVRVHDAETGAVIARVDLREAARGGRAIAYATTGDRLFVLFVDGERRDDEPALESPQAASYPMRFRAGFASLVALDLGDEPGAPRWRRSVLYARREVPGSFLKRPLLLAAFGHVFVPTHGVDLACVSASDGSPRWILPGGGLSVTGTTLPGCVHPRPGRIVVRRRDPDSGEVLEILEGDRFHGVRSGMLPISAMPAPAEEWSSFPGLEELSQLDAAADRIAWVRRVSHRDAWELVMTPFDRLGWETAGGERREPIGGGVLWTCPATRTGAVALAGDVVYLARRDPERISIDALDASSGERRFKLKFDHEGCGGRIALIPRDRSLQLLLWSTSGRVRTAWIDA